MLKKILFPVVFFSVSAFAVVFEYSGVDTLTAEQKQKIVNLVSAKSKEIAEDKVRLKIINDTQNGERPYLTNSIKFFISDSLGLDSNSIADRDFPWTPTLRVPLQNVRPVIIEIVPFTLTQSALITIVDSANAQVSGDTISTKKGGFALINFNNNHRITLHANSKVAILQRRIQLLEGGISVSQAIETIPEHIAPLEIITDKNLFALKGNAFFSAGEFSTAQLYGGMLISQTHFARDTILPGNAISVSDENVVISRIPGAPLVFVNNSLATLPGNPIKFPNTGDFRQRIIIGNSSNQITIDTIIEGDYAYLLPEFGMSQYFAQNISERGIVSPWTRKSFSLRRLNGLKSIEIFDDSLHHITNDRPFTYRGIADTSVRLFIDNEAVPIAPDGRFSHRVMLKDSMNHPEIIVLYNDLSGDTIMPTIFYTGWDERIKMNDSIMGKPAFTTSRIYNWQGIAPTAVSMRINNQEVEIAEDGRFEKTIHLKRFGKYPVIIDVSFENGNTKQITRVLSRERYKSSGKVGIREGVFAAFATAVVGGIIAFSLFGDQIFTTVDNPGW